MRGFALRGATERIVRRRAAVGSWRPEGMFTWEEATATPFDWGRRGNLGGRGCAEVEGHVGPGWVPSDSGGWLGGATGRVLLGCGSSRCVEVRTVSRRGLERESIDLTGLGRFVFRIPGASEEARVVHCGGDVSRGTLVGGLTGDSLPCGRLGAAHPRSPSLSASPETSRAGRPETVDHLFRQRA